MRHVIAWAHPCTHLKYLRHAFYCMFKMDMNLSRRVVFRTPRRSAMFLNKGLQNGCFTKKFPNIFIKIIVF